MKSTWLIAALVVGIAGSSCANATAYDLVFDTSVEAKRLAIVLTSGSTASLGGVLAPGSVTDSLGFTWGASGAFSLGAAWRVGAVVATTPRLVGFNIDLFDSFNSLVASDVFGGVQAEVASSSMQVANLAPGNYTLVITGTAVRDGLFGIDFVAGSLPPPTPSVQIVAPDLTDFVFDTLTGEKSVGNPFPATSLLSIYGVTDELGSLNNRTELILTGGTLSAGISWLVNTTPTPA